MESPNFIAGGTINPARFVTLTGSDFTVSQSNADETIGISEQGSDKFNTTTFVSGDPIRVFGPGTVTLLKVTNAVTRNAKLKPDSNGQGIAVDTSGTTTAPQWFGAIALESANAGEWCRVLVELGYYTYHA